MSPRDDRDIRAALGADRSQRTEPAEPEPQPDCCMFCGTVDDLRGINMEGHEPKVICSDCRHQLEDALLPRCVWVPADFGRKSEPLREAVREALRLLGDANHGDDGTPHHRCHVCEERWPCDVEQARRRLTAALEDR